LPSFSKKSESSESRRYIMLNFVQGVSTGEEGGEGVKLSRVPCKVTEVKRRSAEKNLMKED
jgi:hypothetical protein